MDTVGNIERRVNATRIEIAYQIACELGVHLFAFEPTPERTESVPSPAALALIDLIDGTDEATTVRLLALVRVGLGLAGRRSEGTG